MPTNIQPNDGNYGEKSNEVIQKTYDSEFLLQITTIKSCSDGGYRTGLHAGLGDASARVRR